jgi:XTP/dITP diphosphohydrolase
MELVFVTSNKHKASEVQKVIIPGIVIKNLNDIGCFDDIAETADSFKGNSLLKAEFVYAKYGMNCFADDSGLEVDALNGAPGVYSARYAGEPKSDANNTLKLLRELDGKTNRAARFKTAIALILTGKTYFFEGTIEGRITEQARGDKGFGYDPVFIPNGYKKTFAEMTAEEKNSISHRALAVKQMNEFLNTRL